MASKSVNDSATPRKSQPPQQGAPKIPALIGHWLARTAWHKLKSYSRSLRCHSWNMVAKYTLHSRLCLGGALSSTSPRQPHFWVKIQLPGELYQLAFAMEQTTLQHSGFEKISISQTKKERKTKRLPWCSSGYDSMLPL